MKCVVFSAAPVCLPAAFCSFLGHLRGYLLSHAEELVRRTVPSDSSSLVRSEVKQSPWSHTLFWEFDTSLSASEYEQWVVGNLKQDFKVGRG